MKLQAAILSMSTEEEISQQGNNNLLYVTLNSSLKLKKLKMHI